MTTVAIAEKNLVDVTASLEKLQKAAKKAKKAMKADKNKETKSALKAAKKDVEKAEADKKAAEEELSALKEASKKRKLEDAEDSPSPSKKMKVDLKSLEKAVKKARKAMKADKNKETKAALKAAKAALEKAQKEAEDSDSDSDESSEDEEKSEKEVEVKEEKIEKDEKMEEKVEETETVVKTEESAPVGKGAPNPSNCPKVFVGNLSFQIDEDKMRDFFKDCGPISEVFWLEDRDTGRFKGCGFVTFESPEGASLAVAKNGEMCMEREIRVDYSLPKNGGGAKKSGGSKFAKKGLSERPNNCTTVFAGNLSFDIDEDSMREFAADCGEIKAIRWLTDRDSGDFKGCGFIEFFDSESVDKFVKKNGETLMGRECRLDYSKPRERK